MMENNQKSTESSKEDLENKVMQVLMEQVEEKERSA